MSTCSRPHFTDEETEAQESQMTCEHLTTSMWPSQGCPATRMPPDSAGGQTPPFTPWFPTSQAAKKSLCHWVGIHPRDLLASSGDDHRGCLGERACLAGGQESSDLSPPLGVPFEVSHRPHLSGESQAPRPTGRADVCFGGGFGEAQFTPCDLDGLWSPDLESRPASQCPAMPWLR